MAERLDCELSNAQNLVQTIFTIFENCIINHATILKDRHLDQVMLCAVYIVCKGASLTD